MVRCVVAAFHLRAERCSRSIGCVYVWLCGAVCAALLLLLFLVLSAAVWCVCGVRHCCFSLLPLLRLLWVGCSMQPVVSLPSFSCRHHGVPIVRPVFDVGAVRRQTPNGFAVLLCSLVASAWLVMGMRRAVGRRRAAVESATADGASGGSTFLAGVGRLGTRAAHRKRSAVRLPGCVQARAWGPVGGVSARRTAAIGLSLLTVAFVPRSLPAPDVFDKATRHKQPRRLASTEFEMSHDCTSISSVAFLYSARLSAASTRSHHYILSSIARVVASSPSRAAVTGSPLVVQQMPALAVRDVNLPQPPTSRKDGKASAPTKAQPPPTPAAPVNPLVVQRCIAFLNKLQTQYDASQLVRASHSSHQPPLPELASHLASLAAPAASLLDVGSAYEVVGRWLHNAEKHAQAVAILRNAATVYDACNASTKARLARIDVGRALNATVAAAQQQQPTVEEQGRQTEVEQARQHWTAVQQEVRGKELRLESYACFHHGQLYAQLAAHCGRADMEHASLLIDRAMETWAELADIPTRYAPTVRAADSEQMMKHRQHVLRVEDALQTAAQRCALYGQPQRQLACLRWLADCLSSALLHFPAAICWLQCAIVAASERDSSGARQYQSQAEVSRSQPVAITATTLGRDKVTTYELRYAVLHFQLSVLLQSPSTTPPALAPSLATFLSQPLTSLSFHHQMLRAHLLSVVSRSDAERGRLCQAESRCREEYKLWSSCLRRLFTAHSVTASALSSSTSAADLASLVMARSILSHEQYTVLWWYIDCLYRYARLMERQGQPLLCIAHIAKAAAVCEALDERRQRGRLDRLRWRVRVKLGWQHERWGGGEVGQGAASKEKWEVAADEAVQSLEAALGGAQPSGTAPLEQARLCAELADAYIRRGQLHAAADKYQEALTTVSQPVNEQSAVSAVRQPDTVKRNGRTTTARRGTKQQLQQQSAEAPREAQPAHHRIILQQAVLQAKLAFISISSALTPLHCTAATSITTATSLDDAVASLIHSSAAFQRQQQQPELAWAAYWQAVAQRTDRSPSASSHRSVWSFPSSSTFIRPSTVAISQLASSCTSSCSSLLYSAITSSSASAPPYVSRLLLLSLCSSLGLSAPLDAIFALNASLGIATRHYSNRALQLRSTSTFNTGSTEDSLSEQLNAVRLQDDSSGEHTRAGTQDGGGSESMYCFDGGVERDRERFEAQCVARLPAEWTVVTMALSDDRRHLLVSRLQSPLHERAPIMLRLPLWTKHASSAAHSAEKTLSVAPPARAVRGKGKSAATSAASVIAPATTTAADEASASGYHSVLSELCGVLEASGRVNSSSLRSQHTCTYDERKEWWTQRERLDERMRRLVQRLEDEWFGPWKAVLCGDERDDKRRRQLHDAVLRVTGSVRQLLGGPTSVDPSSPLPSYIRLLLQSSTPPSPSALQSAVAYLLGWTECARESDAAMQAMQSSRSTADWQLLTNVSAMIDAERRLLHPTSVDCHTAPHSHLPVILLLSSELQRLPFESMPVLEGQPITRLPSWLQLLPHLPHSSTLQTGVYTSLSLSSHSYILNPGNDLPRTESTFAPLLPSLGLTNGLTATQPTAAAFQACLASDLFVYIGHGSGDQYIQPHHIATSTQPAGVCLLMGCSSARGRGESVEYEGCEGMVQALLQAGAKCVVGNLWDVTDGECDRFAVRLLEQLTGKHDPTVKTDEAERKQQQHDAKQPAKTRRGRGKRVERQAVTTEVDTATSDAARPRSVCEIVASSRSACRLRSLMGASPVVYGVPAAFPSIL